MKQKLNPLSTFTTLISFIGKFTDGMEMLFDNICMYYRRPPSVVANIYILLFNYILKNNKQWHVNGHYTVFCHFEKKFQRTPTCKQIQHNLSTQSNERGNVYITKNSKNQRSCLKIWTIRNNETVEGEKNGEHFARKKGI